MRRSCLLLLVSLGCSGDEPARARVEPVERSPRRASAHPPVATAIESSATHANDATATAPSAPAPALPPAPCPPDMVRSGRVCIDRYEAHLVERDGHGLKKRHPHFERPTAGVRYAAENAKGVFPQGYISRVEAAAACDAADKRLCTRGEWTVACRGTPSTSCNRAKPHLLPEMFPERNWVFLYDEHFNSPMLNQMPDFLARTGEYDACIAESGAHDLVGNLHEWVSDPVTRELATSFAHEMRRQWQPVQVGNGMFLGGFYSTQNEHGAGCAFTTVAHEPAYHDYSTGFRCCRDAKQ